MESRSARASRENERAPRRVPTARRFRQPKPRAPAARGERGPDSLSRGRPARVGRTAAPEPAQVVHHGTVVCASSRRRDTRDSGNAFRRRSCPLPSFYAGAIFNFLLPTSSPRTENRTTNGDDALHRPLAAAAAAAAASARRHDLARSRCHCVSLRRRPAAPLRHHRERGRRLAAGPRRLQLCQGGVRASGRGGLGGRAAPDQLRDRGVPARGAPGGGLVRPGISRGQLPDDRVRSDLGRGSGRVRCGPPAGCARRPGGARFNSTPTQSFCAPIPPC
jgi:hypothetical protein